MPVIQVSIDNVFAFALFVSGLNALVFSYFFLLIFRRIKEDEFMYSPKISEEHIPKLYKMAKEQKRPMTRLVNEIIGKAISEIDVPASEPATAHQNRKERRTDEDRRNGQGTEKTETPQVGQESPVQKPGNDGSQQ
jgi:hypothetical protein